MLNLNRATIIGNCTRDPEMRYTPNGQGVTSFSVATNRKWTTDGETKEDTEFHAIVAWGKLAEIAHQLLKKGARVYIEGRLKTRSWEGQDGVSRQRTEIIAENIIALSPRSDTQASESHTEDAVSAPKSEAKPATPEPKDKSEAKPAKKEEEIDIDDIPF
jgi:single-strand DNA-binding protein